MGWLGTLLGGLIGFAASVIPEVVSLIRANYFHKFAMEAADKGHAEVMASLSTQADSIAALQAQLAGTPCQQSWIDVLSNTVRPVLTYLFFGMFFTIKISALYHIIYHEHVEFLVAMPVIWDSETSSLFAAIISFWFGSRALGSATGTATQSPTPIASPSRVSGLVNGDTGKK
jgi:hypothetical protein